MSRSLRLFYALWPDDATRHALVEWQSTLSGRKIPPENLHVTLAFLGEQPRSMLPELCRILESLPSNSIRLKLDKTGYFPHSRISWAGMKKTPPDLMRLNRKLAITLSENRIPFDNRNRFRPHITLARGSDHTNIAGLKPVRWNANHLVLAQSRFRRGKKGLHPQYELIAERILDD